MKKIVGAVGTAGLIALAALALGLWLDSGSFLGLGGDAGPTEEDLEAERAVEAAERARSRAEDLEAALDSVYAQWVGLRRRDSARRAELEERVRRAKKQAGAADVDVLEAADSLEAVLRSLSDAVRPSLQPVVDTATVRLDSMKSAHRRTVRNLEVAAARVDTQRASAVATADSLGRLLDLCRGALSSCRVSRDSAFEAVDRLEAANEDPTLLERLGRSVPEILAKGGTLVAACTLPPSDSRLATCAGAGSIIVVDVAVN